MQNTGILNSRLSIAALIAAALVALAALGCQPTTRTPEELASIPRPQPSAKLLDFEATAYSIEGKTASGHQAREGTVAADPKILPIGSRIRVSDAGELSGVYVVADTGRTIKGREIDIYMKNDAGAETLRTPRRQDRDHERHSLTLADEGEDPC
jgi:3D (Asp-Asp-Asp) domain-containing protein